MNKKVVYAIGIALAATGLYFFIKKRKAGNVGTGSQTGSVGSNAGTGGTGTGTGTGTATGTGTGLVDTYVFSAPAPSPVVPAPDVIPRSSEPVFVDGYQLPTGVGYVEPQNPIFYDDIGIGKETQMQQEMTV